MGSLETRVPEDVVLGWLNETSTITKQALLFSVVETNYIFWKSIDIFPDYEERYNILCSLIKLAVDREPSIFDCESSEENQENQNNVNNSTHLHTGA